MSIASEIVRIKNNINDAYTACNAKGATIPATKNSANLATCIGTITGTGNGILETLWANIAGGNNPVDTTELATIEARINSMIQ